MDKLREGIDFYLAGDLYSAVKYLKEYIDEGGHEAGKAYYHLGVAYSDWQRLTEACENLKKATELEPDKSMYHYRLGVVYSRLMILDSAIEELRRSIELNPEHQRSRFILGTVHFQRGDMKKAYDVFSDLIKSSPDFAGAYYNRGLASYRLGDDESCAADLKKALELNPAYDEARQQLAYLYFDRGDFPNAVVLCKQIYENGVRDLIFLRRFIKALNSAGYEEKMREVAHEALVLYPHSQELRQFLDRIEGKKNE